MNEYAIPLAEAKKVGIPLYRCTDSWFKDVEMGISKLKSIACIGDYSYGTLIGEDPSRNFFYLISIGVYGLVLRSIGLDATSSYLDVKVQIMHLGEGAKYEEIPLRLPIDLLRNKNKFDEELFNTLLQILDVRGLKWWSFINYSYNKVCILSYNNTAIGYRFRVAHSTLKPLSGKYAFDMDIDTANKLGFKPVGCAVLTAHLKGDCFVSLEESVGKHVIDMSDCINICRDLIKSVI